MSTDDAHRQNGIATDPNTVRVDAPGGTLVYEIQRERNPVTGTESIVGQELRTVENVTDADALGDALAARGHGRGHALHPEGR